MIIREARSDEYPAIGELRVTAYRALGLLPEGSEYIDTLRGFGFGTDCVVLIATDETGDGILGTIAIEWFDPSSELARDETEADVRAFAVAPQGQGQGVGRTLLQAVIERADKRGLRCLRLCTNPVMQAAQHLYETTGFSRTPDLDWSPAPRLTLRAYELALPRSKTEPTPPLSRTDRGDCSPSATPTHRGSRFPVTPGLPEKISGRYIRFQRLSSNSMARNFRSLQ